MSTRYVKGSTTEHDYPYCNCRECEARRRWESSLYEMKMVRR